MDIFQLFVKVEHLLCRRDRPRRFNERAIDAMLESLDAYTTYIPESEGRF